LLGKKGYVVVVCCLLKCTISQEHTNALSALLNNSQAVNLLNGFISDLSDAAMEVLKEAKVLFTVLLFHVFSSPMLKQIRILA